MKIKYVFYLLILFCLVLFFVGCTFLTYGNKAPTIYFKPLTSIKVNQVYAYGVNAKDFENDNLVYSLLDYPKNMTIDFLSGGVNWTPKEEQVGKHEVSVNVKDRWRNDTQNFTIEASKTLLSSIEVFPSNITLTESSSNLLTRNFLKITANYDDGTSKSITPDKCHYESSNQSIVFTSEMGFIYGASRGTAVITVSYTEKDIVKSDTIGVVVTSIPRGGG